MQNQVNIIADDMGNVIRQSNTNSEFGYISLQEMNWKADQKLAGKIQVREQLEPFSSNDPDRDYKYAGDTGIICCVDGQPIYRKTFFVMDMNAQDTLLAHTNGQDIREANGSNMLNSNSAKPTSAQAFGINVDEKKEEVVDDLVEEEVEVEETVEDFTL